MSGVIRVSIIPPKSASTYVVTHSHLVPFAITNADSMSRSRLHTLYRRFILAKSNEGRWRTNPSNARETTKIVNELARLETVVVAQSSQISTFWDFCNRMRLYLDENDPRGAAAVRAFMQKSNLFENRRLMEGWGKVATEHETADTARPSEAPEATVA